MLDAIVIGAGHNGLTAAAYLAKAGLRVLVLERRERVGGACTTEELLPQFPGFKFNLCASDHILIHLGPVLKDLELERFGLQYLEVDPPLFSPCARAPLFIHKSLELTTKALAKLSERDAKSYSKLYREARPFLEWCLRAFYSPPPSLEALLGLDERLLQLLLMSCEQVLEEHFEEEALKGLMALYACQGGLAPSELGTGIFALLFFLLHRSGLKRPLGGSGALSEALRKALEHFGGRVLASSEVRRIRVRDGRVLGVELRDGKLLESRVIISSIDPKSTFLKLLDGEEAGLGEDFLRRVEGLKIRAYKMKIDCALAGLPNYCKKGGLGEEVRASQLLCPSLEYLKKAYHESSLSHRLSREPALWVATQSALDPSLAPKGGHVLYAWALYSLCDGPRGEEEVMADAERMLDVLERYAPGTRARVLGMRAMGSWEMERLLALPKGNSMHIDTTLDQMFSFRPLPECSNYRTPIKGLYLTGAGTHPMGGISGAPGHNVAKAVLQDWGGLKGTWG